MKPTCENCRTATGWTRAIRTKPTKPLHCGTCAITEVLTAPEESVQCGTR